jgi:uncharacterized membrane protein
MVVFAVRFASRAPRRTLLAGFALSAFLFFRAGSASVARRRGGRPGAGDGAGRCGPRSAPASARYYLVYAWSPRAAFSPWFGRSQIFSFLGRGTDLDGREGTWA